MKYSTLLLFCFFSLFGTVLLANPVRNIFIDPTGFLLTSKPIDSCAAGQNNILPPFFFIDDDTCGMNSGGVNITPDPNTPGPWTYNWSNGATTQDIFGVPAGTYFLAVTDANGNVQSVEYEINDVDWIPPPFAVAGAIGNSTCIAPFNGSLTLNAPNAPTLPPNMYLWSTGATTQNISGLEDGSYTVTISIGATCATDFTFVVPDLANSPSFGEQIADAHCGLSDGGARLLGVQGVAPLTYQWANGNTNSFMMNIPGGDYALTVTGGNGCTSETVLTVPNINWDIDVVDFSIQNTTTCIGGNGSIDIIMIEPNMPGYTYEWDNGATTQDLVNVPAGTYRVTITLTSVCTAQRVYSVDPAPILPQLNFVNSNSRCGLSNGNINLSSIGGTPPFTYIWSNGATTQSLNNVPAGPYDVTITGANGCTMVANTAIDDEPLPINYVGTVTDYSSCDTSSNGGITLVLMPANLSYQWSNGVSSTILTNLAPGDYTVTISAGGTCVEVETYNIANVAAYPVIPIVPTSSRCGLSNGSADMTVNGGATAPFTYLWSNGATTQDLSNMIADTFFVTVTSSVGCSVSNQVIIPNTNDTIKIESAILDNISCATPTGAIDLNLTPLDTAYTFIWSSGQTTDSLFNLAAGNYLVTVTLGLSCIALDTFSVLSSALPPNLSTSSNATNCGLNNGAADLNLTGGFGPFTFIWSNAATTEDLANLTPGTYTVTVTGANSCTAVSSASVLNNNLPLNVNGTPAGNTSCIAGNGSVDIGVSPAGAYNYIWSNSATTEDLNNLAVGTYTVTVSLGTCLSTSTFSVTNNALSPNLSSAGTSANCGLNDGAADLNVSGGTGPFLYLWSTSATTEDLANLLPGSYLVTVTGANGCTAISSANVLNNNIALNVNASPVANTSCTTANGSVDISVAPAGTYNYLWSNAATNEDLSNLANGTYTVIVSFGTCLSTSTFVVADNTVTPILATNITASICSVNNGGIDLTVSGPAAPYTYFWSNAATDEDLSSLLPGIYTVTVTASNGCTEVASLNVPNNASTFSLAGAPVAQTNCATNNGAIDLNVTAPGGGTFTYQWSNSATTEDLNNLAPGTYTVSVTQSGSCTATASYFVLDQRVNPISTQSIVPELCGQTNGSIDLGVNGGTTPYTYQWATGQISQDLNNIAAGNYAVTVTDANNCTATSNAVVPGNSISFALAGTPSANSSCLQNNGAIDLSVNPPGGVSYLWSNLAVTEDLSGLNAGTYTVTVSAGGNCTNTAAFTISSNVPSPQIAQNITAALCGQTSGSIDLTVSGSPTPYQFNWSNAALVEDINTLLSGNYTVTVTAGNGCTTVESFVVPENTIVPNIGSALTQSTSCLISNGAINLTITPPSATGYTFLWSNAAVTEDLANIAAGSYTVTVSGGGSCTNTAVLAVGSSLPLPSIAETIAAAACGQASGSIDLSITVGPTPYGYLWSTGATVEDLNVLLSGNYSVTVSAANGCTAVESFTVQENVITPVVNGLPAAANSCLTFNGAIDLTVNFATAYTLLWSNGSTAEDLTNLSSGSYTVTVNGGGACTNTASFNIANQTTQPQASIASSTTALDCSTTSTTLNGSVSGTPNTTSVQWINNSVVVGNNNALSVSSPGQYNFIVLDNVTSCADTSSITITQSLNPPALTVAAPNLLTCILPNQTLSGSSTVSGVQFAWATITGSDTTILGNGPTLSISTPGTYFLLGVNPANNCENATAVNVIANQNPPIALAGAPFTLDCAGETAGLNGSGSGAANLTYTWTSQDGHFVSGVNTATPQIDEPGVYQLLVTNPANGCTDSDAVTIEPEIPVAFASVEQPSCLDPKGVIQIDSVTGLSAPILYSLNNSQPATQNLFVSLSPGTYTIDVLGGNGCNATTVVVLQTPDPVVLTLSPTATINLGYSYLLDATVNIPSSDIASVSWSPAMDLECYNCLSTLATPYYTTNYEVVVVSNAGCEARGNLNLIVNSARNVYGPNIFSPDGDGFNDFFTIFADPVTAVKVKSLQVYSRWGETVFELRDFVPGDLSRGWDGNFKGQKLNPAVFVWQAIVEFVDGREELFKGDVMLQR